jgi:cysteine desulfurase / selenocysteine lyase
MTTNNNGSGLPDGWPDSAEIERLANELFSAKPGSSRGNPNNYSQVSPTVSTPPAVPGGFSDVPGGNTGVPEHVPAAHETGRHFPFPQNPNHSNPSTAFQHRPVEQVSSGGVNQRRPHTNHPDAPGEHSSVPAGYSDVPGHRPGGQIGNAGDSAVGATAAHTQSSPPGDYSGATYSGVPGPHGFGGRSPLSGLPFEDELHSFYTNLPFSSSLTSAPSAVPGGIPITGAQAVTAFASGDSQRLPFDHIPGIAHGLPLDDLQQQLSANTLLKPNHDPVAGAPSATPSFYFLDYANSNVHSGIVPSYDHRIPSTVAQVSAPFDVYKVRSDFPILNERVNGRPLVWLDNAATTQKPYSVIERVKYFYEHENSNIHRAAHELAARATNAYEEAREKVRGFINAASVKEIVFVRGATEAINLVAQSWGRHNINKGDEIIISWLEHHANIVPWQMLANEKGAHLRVIPVDDDGQIRLEEFGKLLGPKTKLVAFTHVSNALGTVTPVRQMIEMARNAGAKVLLDGAQSVSHMKVDVQALDPDWFVFSGHKLFAPTGIGVLYGKEALLNDMPPWQGGGNMIKDVTFERTEYHNSPERFEAGTGNIADAVGLGAAIDYLNKIGMDFIQQYEHQLLLYATRLLKDCPGLRIIGNAAEKAGVLSFVVDGYTTEEVGTALSKEGIALRSGHHCAQPILRRFGLESSVRPSFAFYNVCSDIDALVSAVEKLSSSRNYSAQKHIAI